MSRGRDLLHTDLDPVDESLRKRSEDAAAEHDGDIQTGDAETSDRAADPRHDLVRLAVEDVDRGVVAGDCRGNHDRGKFSQPVVMEPALMEGDRHIAGPSLPEMAGDIAPEDGRACAPFLRSHCGAECGHPDVGPATPIAADLAEREESGPPTVGGEPHAVDTRADDSRDAPSFVRAGAKDCKRVVGYRVVRGAAELVDGPLQGAFLGRQVGSGHEPRAELGDVPIPVANSGSLACPVDQIADELHRSTEAEHVG